MARPIVGGLAGSLRGRVEVQRVNVLTPEGRTLASRHAVDVVPLLLALDARGRETLREYGMTTAAAVERAVGIAGGR